MANVLVPNYKIYINGKELESTYYSMVNKVQIKETSLGCCRCVIDMTDPNMLIIEGSTIVESTPIKVVFGLNALERTTYSTSDVSTPSSLLQAQERVFEGYVSVIDATFPEAGTPTATLHCMDKTHLMNRKPKTRTWEKCTVSSVAEQIYREYGFKVKVTDSKTKLDSIEQSNETDISFITKLVDEIEDKYFLTYLEGETAHFVERLAPPPSSQVNYRLPPYNLYSFSPRINKESKKDAYPKNDIDLATLKTVSTVVNPTTHNLGKQRVSNTSTRK